MASKSLRKAQEEHQAFLRRIGYKPHLAAKYHIPIPDYSNEGLIKKDINSVANPIIKRNILDVARLEEKAAVRQAIMAKAKRTAPLFSKGAYQYIGDNEDLKTIGRKI